MQRIFQVIAVVAAMAIPTVVWAQERAVDGALGAAAGAVVFGPVGLVAGVVVGATAGPSIASSWGLRHHRHYHHLAREQQ
jgi:hypothetical protein